MKKIILLLLLFHTITNKAQNIQKLNDPIYDVKALDVKPEYPDGLEKLQAYIIENFQKSGKQLPPTAKVVALFVVEKDGSLSDVKIYGKVSTAINQELVKIIKTLPKWHPGKQNGTTVRVLYPLSLFSPEKATTNANKKT